MQIQPIIEEYQALKHTAGDNRRQIREEKNKCLQTIKQMERRIKELSSCETTIADDPWHSHLILSIAKAMLSYLPGWRFEIIGPYEFAPEITVFFYRTGATGEAMFHSRDCLSISFRPSDVSNNKGLRVVDPLGGKQYGGFNQPTIPLPGTVEELIEILDGLNVPNRPKEVQQ